MTGFSIGGDGLKKDRSVSLSAKVTPWRMIWISIGMQFINGFWKFFFYFRGVSGVQLSIYYMSGWPYLSQLDSSASVDFLGWIVASASLGCSIANPIFGYWNQKTLAVKAPTVVGFTISASGQLLYGLLPLFPSSGWWMMIARTVTGIGSGSMSVLRAYVATATVPEDKLKAISYSTAGWVLGVSFGPAIQALFTPIGSGFSVGSLQLDMYTIPAFFMLTITLVSCLLMWVFFQEQYAGILDEEVNSEDGMYVPKFDKIGAFVCIVFWLVANAISTNIEVMSTPMSTVMYGWTDSKSVLYNGIFESLSCVVSVITNFLIGYSRIGQIDKRKQIAFGLFALMAFHMLCYPWPFYPGPLEFIPMGNTSAQIGGCNPVYTWCEDSVAVPLPVYVFCFIFLYGVAFPFIGSPSATLYSDILGPRAQGFMQGMYSLGGSIAQFGAPIISTYLFQQSGYRWVMVMQLFGATLGMALLVLFRQRLVPLRMLSALPSKTDIFYATK